MAVASGRSAGARPGREQGAAGPDGFGHWMVISAAEVNPLTPARAVGPTYFAWAAGKVADLAVAVFAQVPLATWVKCTPSVLVETV